MALAALAAAAGTAGAVVAMAAAAGTAGGVVAAAATVALAAGVLAHRAARAELRAQARTRRRPPGWDQAVQRVRVRELAAALAAARQQRARRQRATRA